VALTVLVYVVADVVVTFTALVDGEVLGDDVLLPGKKRTAATVIVDPSTAVTFPETGAPPPSPRPVGAPLGRPLGAPLGRAPPVLFLVKPPPPKPPRIPHSPLTGSLSATVAAVTGSLADAVGPPSPELRTVTQLPTCTVAASASTDSVNVVLPV
jgi:hypothetical protein